MKMTIELDGITAGTLEVARVARAISRTKELMQRADDEIERTKARLKAHLKRFRADSERGLERRHGTTSESRQRGRMVCPRGHFHRNASDAIRKRDGCASVVERGR